MRKTILAALLILVAASSTAQSSGCSYPYLRAQLARAETSIPGCWFSADCRKARELLASLKARTVVTEADVQAAYAYGHLSDEMWKVGAVMWHIINDHGGVVANHNAVQIKDGA